MSHQAQIFVEKQGSMQKSSWTSRILTLDTATGTATVSRKNNTSKVLHHTLRINGLCTFPHVDLAGSKIHPDSAEAKWTLCLLGCKAPVPDLNTEDVAVVDPYTSGGNAHREKQSSASSDATPAPTPTRKSRRGSMAGSSTASEVADHWLIRCTGQDTYDLAVKLLQKMIGAQDTAAVDHPRNTPNPAKKNSAIAAPAVNA